MDIPLSARVQTRMGIKGPDPLDLIQHLVANGHEVAALNAGQAPRPSVIAFKPIVEFVSPVSGPARWHGFGDLPPLPTLPAALAATPLPAFDWALSQIMLMDDGLGIPLVGWLGYISYDLGLTLEGIKSPRHQTAQWPGLHWCLYDHYYLYNHQTQQYTLAALEWSAVRQNSAWQRLDEMEHELGRVDSAPAPTAPTSRLLAHTTAQQYQRGVKRICEYIAAGDIYQANLAARWQVHTQRRPSEVYHALLTEHPNAWGGLIHHQQDSLVSISPELFLERQGSQLTTHPIKGTRPRYLTDPQRDASQRAELEQSPKEAAELAMIVDLLRNDLGRVCDWGSVQVTQPRVIEALSTVWHTSAVITGQLAPQSMTWDRILTALLPGGSITGTPKIRATQIIAELEDFQREIYCGHMGWIGARGEALLNVAIRTILMRRESGALPNFQADVYAGAGIVADSTPTAEYAEVCLKAQALLAALGITLPPTA
ncbi:MAG: chorismate-binding protein [Phycisphaerae bacterium]